jgi:predicted nucleic acid-binding protein
MTQIQARVITLCDTGPLVAYLNRNDPHHVGAVTLMRQVRPPLLTCEAVLAEASYFLREDGSNLIPCSNYSSEERFASTSFCRRIRL